MPGVLGYNPRRSDEPESIECGNPRMKNHQGTITLPPDVCEIRPNESLQAFIKRIQLAAITTATEAEGNHTRAARRLGYSRTSMVHLIQKIRESEGQEEPKSTRKTNKKKSTKTASKPSTH
jgi:DNA-binding NtrC family response regulator